MTCTCSPSRISARPLSLLLILASVGSTGTATATVTLERQLRSVSTFATVDFGAGEDSLGSDEFLTEDPGPFDGAAHCLVGNPGDQATADAAQLSYVEPENLLAEGNFSAHAEIGDESVFAEAFGRAIYSSTFSVDQPTEVRLRATLFSGGNGRVTLVFRVEDGEIFVYRGVFDGEDSVDDSRVLAAGTYLVELHTSGFGQAFPGGGEPASGSFAMSLTFSGPVTVSPFASGRPLGGLLVVPNPVRDGARILLSGRNTIPGGPSAGDPVFVFDSQGRLIRRLEGLHAEGVDWDARDEGGRAVPAGVYLVRCGTGPGTRVAVVR